MGQLFGSSRKNGVAERAERMAVAAITEKMIAFFEGDLHEINHFLKVWAYAKTIGELESLNAESQYILEVSAIIHDIACPLCRKKYGNADGKHQEEESEPLVTEFLQGCGLTEKQTERIVYLVSHHHTYTNVNSREYQILLEADYLVNAEELRYSSESIANARNHIFKTKSGKTLLKSIYRV